MSDEKLPKRVDVRIMARQQARLTGHVPLAELDRLAQITECRVGAVQVDMHFSNNYGEVTVTGQIAAELLLVCQRCCRTMTWPVKQAICLRPVHSENDDADCPPDVEPWLVEQHQGDLWQLVEEELLLGLPVIARHDDPCCAEGNEE